MEENYSLIWKQCTELMQQKLLGMKRFQSLSTNNDGIGLHNVMETTTYQFEGRQYPSHAYTLQEEDSTCATKAELLQLHHTMKPSETCWKSLTAIGGSLGSD
jgi:hypothetical protein